MPDPEITTLPRRRPPAQTISGLRLELMDQAWPACAAQHKPEKRAFCEPAAPGVGTRLVAGTSEHLLPRRLGKGGGPRAREGGEAPEGQSQQQPGRGEGRGETHRLSISKLSLSSPGVVSPGPRARTGGLQSRGGSGGQPVHPPSSLVLGKAAAAQRHNGFIHGTAARKEPRGNVPGRGRGRRKSCGQTETPFSLGSAPPTPKRPLSTAWAQGGGGRHDLSPDGNRLQGRALDGPRRPAGAAQNEQHIQGTRQDCTDTSTLGLKGASEGI